jgi:Protein of unknown function (DUF1565)
MKKIFITITILLSYVLLFLPSAEAGREWYVSTSGNDTSSGSIQSPFYTIQRAIDAANDEDIIIVMAGRHKGPGNRNLNFLGKAITVRSRNPDDNECLRATIIDAEGQGVIVRFVYDEGPDSVFEGFTLGAGDTLPPVQGVPGFFEFSDNARPTTRRLRLLEESLQEQVDGEFPLKPFDYLPKSQILSAEEPPVLG